MPHADRLVLSSATVGRRTESCQSFYTPGKTHRPLHVRCACHQVQTALPLPGPFRPRSCDRRRGSYIGSFVVAQVTSRNERVQRRDLCQAIIHAGPSLRLNKRVAPFQRPHTSPPEEDRFLPCTHCRISKRQQIATALARRSFPPSWASRHTVRIPEAHCSQVPSKAVQGRTTTNQTLSTSPGAHASSLH